jgi:hypothetical protein
VSSDDNGGRQRIKNLGLAALAAQAGCVTIGIIFLALILGLWLDSQLEQNGLCTFGVLVLSIPFSLYLMLRIALGAINRIQPQVDMYKQKQDAFENNKEV